MKNNKILVFTLIIALLLSLTVGCKEKVEHVNEASSYEIFDENTDSAKYGEVDAKEVRKKDEEQTISNEASKFGLLIGLACSSEGQSYDNPTKRSADELRALWIYSDQDLFYYEEKNGVILASSEDGIFELKNELFEMMQESGLKEAYDFYSKYNFHYSYNNISSNLLGQERKPLYTEESFRKLMALDEPDWPYRTRVEWPAYVGDKYALLISDYYETGGGTFRRSLNAIRLYELGSLGKMYERDQTKILFEFLDKQTQGELLKIVEDFNRDAEKATSEMEKSIMDLDNLILARKSGRWIIRIPVFRQYYHEGNGSYLYTLSEYIDYDGGQPSSLIPYDNLPISWESIVEAVPEAVDALGSPDNKLLVIVTSQALLIFKNPKEGLNDPVLKIPMDSNARIVLNQWAKGDEIEDWNKNLKKYFITLN